MTDARSETTAYGPKKIVDVMIVNGEDVFATFIMLFEDTSAGAASLTSMQEAAAAKAPLAFWIGLQHPWIKVRVQNQSVVLRGEGGRCVCQIAAIAERST